MFLKFDMEITFCTDLRIFVSVLRWTGLQEYYITVYLQSYELQ